MGTTLQRTDFGFAPSLKKGVVSVFPLELLFTEEKDVEDEEEEMMAIDEVGADDETKVPVFVLSKNGK